MDDRSDDQRGSRGAEETPISVTRPKKDIPAGAAALAKGLTLLDLIADADQPMRFAELMSRTDLPKPTFARILRTLIAFGLVYQDESDGTYALGPRFLELTHRVWDTFNLATFALPELEKLSKELGETVALCRLDGDQVLYLEERSGDGLGVRVDVGRRVPLHCTAAGKALLAFQEPAMGRSLLDQLKNETFTDKTITDRRQLEADLTLTRARGYSVSEEEHLPGVNSVAAVISGKDGLPIGALVVLGPSSRLGQTEIHPTGRELIAAARRITGSAGTVALSSRPRPRVQNNAVPADLECVLPWGAQLGEAPMWHEEHSALYWVDILHPAVYRFSPESGQNQICSPGKLVSAILPSLDGQLYVVSQDGIEILDFNTGKTEGFANPETGLIDNRLNDAKVGPGGAIWVGSMRLDGSKPTGALYRVDGRAHVEKVESGVSVSNGMGWSPDYKTFYFIDTVPRIIYAYDAQPGTGEIKNKRIFAQIPEQEGRPGGLTVDAEGGVWCAIWDGWRVNRYLPDGTLDRFIDLPVPRPTSLGFGGDDLQTLYITSARTRLPASTLAEAPLSGGLFACKPGVKGIKSNFFQTSAKGG